MHDRLSERGLGSQDGHLGVVGLRRPGQEKSRSGGRFAVFLCGIVLVGRGFVEDQAWLHLFLGIFLEDEWYQVEAIYRFAVGRIYTYFNIIPPLADMFMLNMS